MGLPVDAELSYELDAARRGRFVEIRSARAGEEELEATAIGGVPDSALGLIEYVVRRALVGSPLRSSAVAEERMRNLLGAALAHAGCALLGGLRPTGDAGDQPMRRPSQARLR